jgi:hypothetical protein
LPIHVLGFPGVYHQNAKFDHKYSIFAGEIMGIGKNQVHLNVLMAPGLSGGAVVCSSRGVALAYIVGGVPDTSYEPTQNIGAYAYKIDGLPYIPGNETNEWPSKNKKAKK